MIPDEVLQEHAYLVARGVRPIAIVGECRDDPLVMLGVSTRLEALGASGAIPFVCPCGDGVAEYGYAARQWVLDLFRWVVSANENAVPTLHRHRILGLLLGYGLDTIRDYEEHNAGRMYDLAPTPWRGQAAT